ncbi:peptidase S24/S26A/S26B/S26C [Syncephalis fuscata]|nr:peptidase S24/S26A/S26B/S26C [Syncephalis fuscata]
MASMFTWVPRPLVTIIKWSPVALVFLDHGYTLAVIQGRSMQPTLNPDTNKGARDIVLLNRRSPRRPLAINGSGGYQRGDIVTLRSPTDPCRVIIKRVVATAGDKVQVLPPSKRSQPIKQANPSYLPQHAALVATDTGSTIAISDEMWITIPRGHCWVEGDDPFHSRDSNAFGPVPVGLIQSRVACIVWPLQRFGMLSTNTNHTTSTSASPYPLLSNIFTHPRVIRGTFKPLDESVYDQSIDWQESKRQILLR